MHCKDSSGFLDAFASLQLRETAVTGYQFPTHLMDVVESQSFIYGDGSRPVDAISLGNLHLLLTRDFCLSEDQAKIFVRRVKAGDENDHEIRN